MLRRDLSIFIFMEHKPFYFKNFSLYHHQSALKIGTDAVLLSATIPIRPYRSVLDIGTGCGVILFCVADQLNRHFDHPHTLIGFDSDRASIDEAIRNLEQFPHPQTQAIQLLHSSLGEIELERSFDLMMSNPPYFGNSLLPPDLKKTKSKHRNKDFTWEKMVQFVVNHLDPEGLFALILPVAEMQEFDRVVNNFPLYPHYQLNIEPIAGKPINRMIKFYSKNRVQQFEEETLCIRTDPQTYSDAYRALTEPFYLHF